MYIYNKSTALFLTTGVIFILSILILGTSSCTPTSFRERADSLFLITDHVNVYYDLKRPEEKHFLPYVLSEVSGLTHLNASTVLCVEDEGGRVYVYDLDKREIVHAITFSDPGDFEGVEYVNDTVYALESDGDVYEFRYTSEKEAKTEKYETPLSTKNDTEGLGYDPTHHRLLIACKEEEDIKGVNAKGKTIYAFDLKKKKLIKEPIFEVSAGKMDDFFEANRDYKYDKDRIKFEPSAIALNPLDGYFYLLASTGKMLIVLSPEGDIKATYPIAPRILSQPEGISFSPEGHLYISSEGEGDKGYIIRFSPLFK
ncbi:SdiA-regulated domain-containing protein [Marinoscillum furvescens]|uniref:Uncharacterized protein YjiK n=1 Tax=Marinoscillum furvescens DSM 4134 TaxID=1122208 RepID=A0A3D9LG79_MARFU|nr:SdiA-regulated domain-containing protein [Marinoscillum furvescens]REE05607.1 uncharacterized protein YjiK [Marinoscillum furvescens DSM 4134]